MAELTAKTRNKIPSSEFGEPRARKYPEQDRRHAANAESRASAQYHKGALSAAAYHSIIAKAKRVLGRTAAGRGPEK